MSTRWYAVANTAVARRPASWSTQQNNTSQSLARPPQSSCRLPTKGITLRASGERSPPEPGAVDRLTALTTGDDDALVREAAVAALGAIGDPAGVPAVLTATGDKATVRRRAVIALAPFDGPDVDAALERATTDRDWQVRQAAEDLTD